MMETVSAEMSGKQIPELCRLPLVTNSDPALELFQPVAQCRRLILGAW